MLFRYMIFELCDERKSDFFQVSDVTVKLSDELELVPLTLSHVQGPLVLHVLILGLATLVWLAELCIDIWQRMRRNRLSKITHARVNVRGSPTAKS